MDPCMRGRSRAPFMSMFAYADAYDKALMAFGVAGAIGDGCLYTGTLLITSDFINTVARRSSGGGGGSGIALADEVQKYVRMLIYVAAAAFVACFTEAYCWMRTGERQASRIRGMYLWAILRQDEGFFDGVGGGTSTSDAVACVGADCLLIRNTISEKVVHFIVNAAGFITGYLVAFYLSWRLALVSLALLPFLCLPGIFYGKMLVSLAGKVQAEYTKANTVAQQAISAVRTVYSFVGEEKAMAHFSVALDRVLRLGLKQGLAKGVAAGSSGVTFGIWAFMAWYGSTLVLHHDNTGGEVFATGLAVMYSGLYLGRALPDLKHFSEAAIITRRITQTVKRIPVIDSYDRSGHIPETITGDIHFREVDFAYPARPESLVLRGFSLRVPAGKTVALVGGSGSGKSTAIALLQRFYDPIAGEILLDDTNIKDLQLRWMRDKMGLVSQEPILFATTVKANILLGKGDATMEEVMAATRKANADEFIERFSHGYETMVGERGVQISGGQKQRIAIARALIKDPTILLLDEATSALDAESEKTVQDAIERASFSRTTIIVAHRLSTIQYADIIAVVNGGRIEEIGTHDELLRKGAAYSALVSLQRAADDAAGVGDESHLRRLSSMRSVSSSLSYRTVTSEGKSAPLEMRGSVPKPPSFWRLFSLNLPEWKHAIAGCVSAVAYGVVQPVHAIVLVYMVFALYLHDEQETKRKIRIYSTIFALVALAYCLTNIVQYYSFGAMGENATKRTRERMLAKILSFEIAWFDKDENKTATVCSRIATEANVVCIFINNPC